MNPNSYINYFRQLAIRHNKINHDPGSETGDSSQESRRFARISGDEFISGLRSKTQFPALMIEMFEAKTKGETHYDIKGDFYGAFSIFQTADMNNATEQEQAYQEAWCILNDIIRQIIADHYGPDKDRCQTPFQTIDLNMELLPVGPVWTGQYGWRCEFSFKPRISPAFNKAPDPGTFKPPVQ